MFSGLRTSANEALEKAKLAISNRQLDGTNDYSRNEPVTDNDIDEVEQQQKSFATTAKTEGDVDDDGVLSPAKLFSEFRTSSTRALEQAKLVLLRNGSNSSNIDNSSDNNDQQQKLKTNATDDESTTSQSSIDRIEELSRYCPKLTWQQRIIGFLMSFSLGYLIAFFSFRFFIRLVEGHPLPFALNYTFGHILQLLASTFLCGPKRQFKNMFDEKRRQTSIIYLSCLVLTLIFVFVPLPKKIKLTLLLLTMMIQFCASCWYSLSYIPYGRRTTLKIIKSMIGIEDNNNTNTATNFIGIQLPGRNGVMA